MMGKKYVIICILFSCAITRNETALPKKELTIQHLKIAVSLLQISTGMLSTLLVAYEINWKEHSIITAGLIASLTAIMCGYETLTRVLTRDLTKQFIEKDIAKTLLLSMVQTAAGLYWISLIYPLIPTYYKKHDWPYLLLLINGLCAGSISVIEGCKNLLSTEIK